MGDPREVAPPPRCRRSCSLGSLTTLGCRKGGSPSLRGSEKPRFEETSGVSGTISGLFGLQCR